MAVLSFLEEIESEKKSGIEKFFDWNFLRVSLPTNIFAIRQILKGDFHNVSSSDSTILQRIRFSNNFLNQKFITGETYNQQFHKSSDFEWRFSQRVRFCFKNITLHHILKYKCFYKIKFRCETRFRKKCQFTPQKRQRFLFRAFFKSWLSVKLNSENIFDWKFRRNVRFRIKKFTSCQI